MRFVVRMRGRERAVTDRWVAQLNELVAKLDDIGMMTARPQLEGGGVTATVEPKREAREAREARMANARESDEPPLDDLDDDLDDDDDDDDDLDDDDDTED